MKIVIIADQTSVHSNNNDASYLSQIYKISTSNYKNVFVLCPESAADEIAKVVPKEVIMTEPQAKGTATAIGLAAAYFANSNPKELVSFIFANQQINNQDRLIATLRVAQDMYKQLNTMLLIGVAITGKTNNYGYVKVGKAVQEMSGVVAFEMLRFERNPSSEKISEYMQSWQYLWDTGCLLCTPEDLLEIYKKTIPELFTGLLTIKAALGTKFENEIKNTVYKTFNKISVAKGLYEKIDTNKLLVIPVDLGIKEHLL